MKFSMIAASEDKSQAGRLSTASYISTVNDLQIDGILSYHSRHLTNKIAASCHGKNDSNPVYQICTHTRTFISIYGINLFGDILFLHRNMCTV